MIDWCNILVVITVWEHKFAYATVNCWMMILTAIHMVGKSVKLLK